MRFLLVEWVDEESGTVGAGGVTVMVAVAGAGAVTGELAASGAASLSAGCLAGRATTASLSPPSLLSDVPCMSSWNPISPRFAGNGPACGRMSSVEVVGVKVLVDAAVDAI